jgi:hypothetical protein
MPGRWGCAIGWGEAGEGVVTREGLDGLDGAVGDE